jgi:hypothetical protein
MATLPAFFRRNEEAPGLATRKPAAARPERDPFELRALPHEDVFFYCKKIDNSRLVREQDPKSRGACWSAIATACGVMVLLAGAMAPALANRISGYELESLKAEQARLLDARRTLEWQEAELLSPSRLERLAVERRLVAPLPGQVVRLDGKGDSAVAMVKQ